MTYLILAMLCGVSLFIGLSMIKFGLFLARKTPNQYELTRLSAENERLLEAVREIRGWREIGRADTHFEILTAIEEICDAALAQNQKEKVDVTS